MPGALPELPPGYVWVPQPPPVVDKPWKTPRWLVIATIAWVVVLAVSGTIYALHGKSTVREQTTVASAQPTIDRAITNVIAAAGSGPIVAVGPFVKTKACKITPVRSGVEYVRDVVLVAEPGTESAILKMIAAGLPASYGARSGPGNILDLYADAGNFVGLVGTVPSPGEIQIQAETGCREEGPQIVNLLGPPISATEMAPIRAVLNAAGLTATSTSAAEVSCLDGRGVLRTVSAHVPPGPAPIRLDQILANIAPNTETAGQNLVAYRSGTLDVIATQDSTGVTVSATQRCTT